MDIAVKITLVASIVLVGYNLHQLVTSYEAICEKVKEFKAMALENDSDESSIRRSNFLLTGTLSVLFILLTYLNADAAGAVSATGDIAEEVSDTFFNLSLSLGIGKSWQIIFLAPFMLLFCYNTVPKNKTISMIIPIIAIAVSVIIVFEAARMGIGMMMEGKQINLNEIAAMFETME